MNSVLCAEPSPAPAFVCRSRARPRPDRGRLVKRSGTGALPGGGTRAEKGVQTAWSFLPGLLSSSWSASLLGQGLSSVPRAECVPRARWAGPGSLQISCSTGPGLAVARQGPLAPWAQLRPSVIKDRTERRPFSNGHVPLKRN